LKKIFYRNGKLEEATQTQDNSCKKLASEAHPNAIP